MKLACAIYTRKSSEEGLEQSFNSLEAQREACEAYVLSQKSQGWHCLPARYDDGGFSGGTLERPALQRLLGEVVAGRIEVIVVYKVDRLTRSLADFAKLVELLDAHQVSFVSVTQQFNTTSSMGRLTLNVLLSFAQFEREVTGERIRDKIAASKAKGLWMGGLPPMGYRPHERTLVVEPVQAERVRFIFERYLALGTVRKLQADLAQRGWRTPARMTRVGPAGERPFSRGHLHRILANPVYLGQIAHKGRVHPGQHPPIIEEALWQAVQARLAANLGERRHRTRAKAPSLLAGLVFDGHGDRLTPVHTHKGGRRYQYYVSNARHLDAQAAPDDAMRAPAPLLDQAVLQALVGFLRDAGRISTAFEDQPSRLVRRAIDTAQSLAKGLADAVDRHSLIETVQRLIAKVVVAPSRLTIAINVATLVPADEREAIVVPLQSLEVPIEIQRWGMAVRLVVKGPNDRSVNVDSKLVSLVAQARTWFEQLASGEVKSVAALASIEGRSSPYVARVLQLAFLAPDIVASIAKGEQPSTLTAKRMMAALPLSSSWPAQRARLGFPAKS